MRQHNIHNKNKKKLNKKEAAHFNKDDTTPINKKSLIRILFKTSLVTIISFFLFLLISGELHQTNENIIHCGNVSEHLVKINNLHNENDAKEYLKHNLDFNNSFNCIKNAFLNCDHAEIILNKGQKLQVKQTDEHCTLQHTVDYYDYGLKCLFPYGTTELVVSEMKKELEEYNNLVLLQLTMEAMKFSSLHNETKPHLMQELLKEQSSSNYIDFAQNLVTYTELPENHIWCKFYKISQDADTYKLSNKTGKDDHKIDNENSVTKKSNLTIKFDASFMRKNSIRNMIPSPGDIVKDLGYDFSSLCENL